VVPPGGILGCLINFVDRQTSFQTIKGHHYDVGLNNKTLSSVAVSSYKPSHHFMTNLQNNKRLSLSHHGEIEEEKSLRSFDIHHHQRRGG
jgi:hypothetical protein